MGKVLCVGGVTTDLLVKPVDRLPSPGALQQVDSIATSVGGCATNCAIDLAKLGVPAAVACRVGRDQYGDFVASVLEENGVDTAGLVRGEEPTTVSVVCVHSNGERSFLYYPGSTAAFCLEDMPPKALEGCGVVFVAGAMLMSRFDGEPCGWFLDRCRKEGRYTVMDTSWDVEGVWLPKIQASLEGLDLFMPSYEEAKELSGQEEPEKIARFFQDLGVKAVVVKMGAKGAFFQPPKGEGQYFPTYRQIKPVDTTGAGDSFCAGVLAGLAMDWPLSRCIPFANAVGTHCVMEIGASKGIRPMEEILAFMQSHDPMEEGPWKKGGAI